MSDKILEAYEEMLNEQVTKPGKYRVTLEIIAVVNAESLDDAGKKLVNAFVRMKPREKDIKVETLNWTGADELRSPKK